MGTTVRIGVILFIVVSLAAWVLAGVGAGVEAYVQAVPPGAFD